MAPEMKAPSLINTRVSLGILVLLSIRSPSPSQADDGGDFPLISDDIEVSLFARDPIVRNSCAITFDSKGRLCVGMGPQYRAPSPDPPPDSVWIVTDEDGDGVAETRKEFAVGFNYSGEIDSRHVGLLVVPHPDNPRTSWSHSHDYGVLVSNPFPKQPKEHREPYVTTTVKKGEHFRLRYTALIHEVPVSEFDPAELTKRLTSWLSTGFSEQRR